ncbi:pilus assembly protein TadD [Sphingopyxis sp. BSNA05]|uniref:SPOR domain-containing protein n=1 Tax=Sphingopyxis sp. BSNA05 TaxID=1236614 RepID=UPI0015636764|nr:SPOR domain-containing protein [Sphingopyxis sp. BSNA05]NRD90637.1 pilus assembly protein TadD [Sphingopyxis sp. BSNA05]
MKRDVILKMAASSMVFATVLTGCGPFGGGSVASMSSKPATVKDGAKYAKKAEKALAKGDLEAAIAYAERSVAGVGSDPETRALLGQAYLSAGRMASAERSFQDAMELGKRDARTILSLSLAQLGQGKADKAKTLVVNNRQYIPAADYGLALALAGDSKTAIEVLEQAIRGSNVTGRTRQNLGLAYALDGRWKEAKLMAVQDVAPAAVNERVMEWAQMARPGAYQTRIATVLNVTPVANDPGQPAQLALRLNFAPTNVAASPEQDYGREVASFDRNTPLPAVGPAPKAGSDVDFLAKENNVKVASVALPASSAVAKATAPAAKAQAKPALAATPANFVVERDKPAPVKTAGLQNSPAAKPILQKTAYQPESQTVVSTSGTHLVQLGAFSSPASAKRAWGILSARNSDLKSFQYASSRVNVKGRTLYRLAAIGFGNAQTAEAMCDGIKAKGGNCIVRHATGINKVAPSRMASQAPKKLASR